MRRTGAEPLRREGWHTLCNDAVTEVLSMLEPTSHREPNRPREPELPVVKDPVDPGEPKIPEMPPPVPDPPEVVGAARR